MNRNPTQTLQRELRLAGAHDAEITELTSIATSLRSLSGAGSIVPGKRGTRHWLLASGLATASLALTAMLVVYSQSVLPGSWLYSVQKVSDTALVSLRPSYRGTVMMRRAAQVNQLIAQHATTPVVLATLSQYNNEAAAYKRTANTYASYAVFDHCKASLQRAAGQARGTEHQAIVDTLASLENT